jgi:DNA-damage-inducible protein D
MSDSNIEKRHHRTFEELKHHSEGATEFWYARDIQTALDYSSWDKFKRVIQKAISACENSGQDADHHFSHAGKMVELGSIAQREIDDYRLSCYACYLIVQNAESSKPVIANGQTYFAIGGVSSGGDVLENGGMYK